MSLAGKDFQKRVSELAQSLEFADFTIECGTQSWNISSFVISAHSPFFKRVCLGPFKEGQERKVTLVDDEPHIVKAMMQFFYDVDYQWENFAEEGLLFHAKVFNLADKYDIESLKQHIVKDVFAHECRPQDYITPQRLIQALLTTTPEAYSAAPHDDRFRHLMRRLWISKHWGPMPVYITARKADLDGLDEVAPTLCYEVVHYLATPENLVEREEWSVNASRVYGYVRKFMETVAGTMMIKLSVKDVATELGLDEAEASRAATILGGKYSGASWHPDDIVDGAHWVRRTCEWGGEWAATDW